MTTRYPFGYQRPAEGGEQGMGTMLTLDELAAKTTVNRLDPEMRRRTFALMQAAATAGVPLGIGTGWRVQPDPPPPGFAQPGNSYHESFPAGSDAANALACDMVPASAWDWMEPHLAAYGLRSGRAWSTVEPWHIQPAEIPGSRNFRVDPITLEPFPLPEELELATAQEILDAVAGVKADVDKLASAFGTFRDREARRDKVQAAVIRDRYRKLRDQIDARPDKAQLRRAIDALGEVLDE